MSDTLLMILIGLMVLNLVVLSGAVAGLALALRKQLPEIRDRIDTVQARVVSLLDETIPTLQGTHKALDEATRALHEAAETVQNLHILTDNLRHKLEVMDTIGAKVRRVPEKTARMLGKLVQQTFKFSGQLIARQLERSKPQHPTIYQPIVERTDTTISAESTAETTSSQEVTETNQHKEG